MVSVLAGVLQAARRVCGMTVGEGYSQWFHRMFAQEDTSLVKTKKHLVLLTVALASLVPTDGAIFLQIHVACLPKILANKYKDDILDYLALARTRLFDLEGSSLSIEPMVLGGAAANSTRQEVYNAVVTFSRTGRVPNAVLEMSIFKSRYFKDTFIPALVSYNPPEQGTPDLLI